MFRFTEMDSLDTRLPRHMDHTGKHGFLRSLGPKSSGFRRFLKKNNFYPGHGRFEVYVVAVCSKFGPNTEIVDFEAVNNTTHSPILHEINAE